MNKETVLVVPFIFLVALSVFATPAVANGVFTNVDFVAHLSGDEEVPVVMTQAQGQAIFHVNNDGTEVHFKLIVANIENVLAAHIHLAPIGVNGPIVAFLYGFALIEGRTQGILSEGIITEANLVGPLAGHPLTHLISVMSAGNTYANVHTTQHPAGEIRGQIVIAE